MNKTALAMVAAFVLAFTPLCAAGELGDQLPAELKLTDTERAGLEPGLAHYYALDGSKSVLAELLLRSAGCGCRENCMVDVVTAVTRAMRAGVAPRDAAKFAIEALDAVSDRCADRKIEIKSEEMSRAVVMKFDLKLREREASSLPSGNSPGAR